MAIPSSTLDPYKFEFDATVIHITDDGAVELDQTYFYPLGGGQPGDTGKLLRNDEEFSVGDTKKQDSHIIHILDKQGLSVGDKVHGIIDQERRLRLMRMHTATHVLCAVLEQKEGALITGNQIGTDKTRVDFSVETFDPEKLRTYVAEANAIIASHPAIRKYVTTRDDLLKNPQLVKLAMGFPENVREVHMMEIMGFDLQPCGGTHVNDLSEIGTLEFVKAESKGTKNRRVYFTLVP